MTEEISGLDEFSLLGSGRYKYHAFDDEYENEFFNEIHYIDNSFDCMSFEIEEKFDSFDNIHSFPQSLNEKSLDEDSPKICAERKSSMSTDDSSDSPRDKIPITINKIEGSLLQDQKFQSVKFTIGSFNSVSHLDYLFSSVPRVGNFSGIKTKDCFITKSRCCNCKKSKCLKLYCECFANGTVCQGCSCVDCHNIENFRSEIEQAQKAIDEKNPFSLKRRVSETDSLSCNCSKSGCLKKYCECYKGGRKCGIECNCAGCKNTTALKAISYKKTGNGNKKRKIEM